MNTGDERNVIAITVKPISPVTFIASSYATFRLLYGGTVLDLYTSSSTTNPTRSTMALARGFRDCAHFGEHREGADQRQRHVTAV